MTYRDGLKFGRTRPLGGRTCLEFGQIPPNSSRTQLGRDRNGLKLGREGWQNAAPRWSRRPQHLVESGPISSPLGSRSARLARGRRSEHSPRRRAHAGALAAARRLRLAHARAPAGARRAPRVPVLVLCESARARAPAGPRRALRSSARRPRAPLGPPSVSRVPQHGVARPRQAAPIRPRALQHRAARVGARAAHAHVAQPPGGGHTRRPRLLVVGAPSHLAPSHPPTPPPHPKAGA